MTLKYTTTFAVTGKHRFPIDMLRHDACFPQRSQDASAIQDSFSNREEQQVVLVMYHEYKDHNITEGRWESFSWPVIPESVITRRL